MRPAAIDRGIADISARQSRHAGIRGDHHGRDPAPRKMTPQRPRAAHEIADVPAVDQLGVADAAGMGLWLEQKRVHSVGIGAEQSEATKRHVIGHQAGLFGAKRALPRRELRHGDASAPPTQRRERQSASGK